MLHFYFSLNIVVRLEKKKKKKSGATFIGRFLGSLRTPASPVKH